MTVNQTLNAIILLNCETYFICCLLMFVLFLCAGFTVDDSFSNLLAGLVQYPPKVARDTSILVAASSCNILVVGEPYGSSSSRLKDTPPAGNRNPPRLEI